jgi:hypothetical protein
MVSKIKSLFAALLDVAESLGQARAAAHLARCGHWQLAKELYQK